MMSLLLIPLMVLSADEPKWELSTEDNGIKIYGRKKADSEVREMKAEGVVDATPQEIWKAIRDYEGYTKNMPYTEEAKVLKRDAGRQDHPLLLAPQHPAGRPPRLHLEDPRRVRLEGRARAS